MSPRWSVLVFGLCATSLGCSSGTDGEAKPLPGSSGDASADGADAGSDGSSPEGGCFPETCDSLGTDCGTVLNGCGGTIECGSCADGETCGAAGPNRCGVGGCEPKTCSDLDAECGWASDGCAGLLNCGGCPPPTECAGNGTPNRCECTPSTCAEAGAECGTLPDGCGGVLECGSCQDGETCGGGGPNQCGSGTCSPKTCVQLGASCGWVSDGCATAIECGTCEPPDTCGGGGTDNVCGCEAKTCAQVGASCGMLDTGCGPVDCGSCTAPETCGGGGIANVCGCTCSLPHAITSCEAGKCSILSCEDGWDDCNGADTDGCEGDLSSTAHCGICGNTCSFPHADATCQGSCKLGACDPDYEDCDDIESNGCEIYTRTDPDHCGGCFHVCSLPHTSQEGCSGGVCTVVVCSALWGNCDGIDSNGCERDLDTMSDCGACGQGCGAYETCVNGSCRCGSGPGCADDEYCYAGKGCYDLPTMTWTPTCMNAGVDHVAPDYTYDFTIYGRPWAAAVKYNRFVSCGKPAEQAETFTLGGNGSHRETFESSAAGCIGVLGQWEVWAEVDGYETNHLFVTYYSTSCSAASTCSQANSYCPP